jgi:TatD DNase family protein
MLIDSHIHLDAAEFDADRAAVIAAAHAAGVGGFVIPAVAPFNFQAVRDLAHSFANSVYCLGIHPLYVMPMDDSALQTLALQVAMAVDMKDPRFAGIGEIGLDFYVPGLDAAKQEHFYIEQLKLAQRFKLPVVLHVRRSQDALLKGLRRHAVPGGIAHAFNGSTQQAQEFLKLGFKLGFGGAATYSGSQRIRRLAAELPLDALVLETDSPDIPPQWLDDGKSQPGSRGRNTPAELPRIAAEIAGLRNVPFDELTAQCAINTAAALPALGRLLQTSAQ